jgi:hypothetical protein
LDLTPEISLSLVELNAATKQRASALLEEVGIKSFDALGGAFWADILFVTARSRDSLIQPELDALAKASAGLGYQATQYALLCDGQTLDKLCMNAYVRALGASAVVFLEPELVPDYGASEPPFAFVRVSNFFDSLKESDDQLARKQKVWLELQEARCLPAMP